MTERREPRGQAPPRPVSTRAGEATLRALASVPDLMFRVRGDGTMLAFLAGSPDRLSIPADQLVGKNVSEILPGDVAGELIACSRRALAVGGVQTCEYFLEVRGRPNYYEARVVASGDDEVLWIVRDATDRWAAEENLRLTQFAVDRAADAVFWIDSQARFAYVNDAACRALGYSRDELLQMSVKDVDPAYPAELWPQHWAEVKARGSFTLESFHRRKSGETFPVEVTVNYQQHAGREYNYAFARDITERKRAEQQLVAQNQFLRTVLESLAHPFYVVDAKDYSIVMANSATRMNEAAGVTTCHALTHHSAEPCHLRGEMCPVAKVKATRRPVTVEHEHFDAGEPRIKELHAYPILDAQGEVVQVIVYSLDVTEAKRTEQALAQAKATAEQATRAKDEFISVLSHELRTPFAAVLSGVELLEREPTLGARARASLEVVRRNLALGTRLMDDMLDLARIARGKLELRPSVVDLHDAIGQVAAMCRGDIEPKQLELVLSLGAARSTVLADPVRLHQMLWNLIRNAVKFTPGGGRIEVRTELSEREQIIVRVKDSGIGIDPAMLDRVFEAFEQGREARQNGGLGLGLTITRRLAELQGGSITVHSEGPGRGAEFVLGLPLDAGPAVAAPPLRTPLPVAHEAPCRILLVDDDADTVTMLSCLLRTLGCEVQTADGVASALAAAERQPFDILLSDVGLPDGTGHELMRRLAARVSIRGIALTGYGMDEDIRKSKEAGFLEHLVKPADIRTIEDALRRVLAQPLAE